MAASTFGVVGLGVLLENVPYEERAAALKARFAETIAKAMGGGKSCESKAKRRILEKKRRMGEAKIKALKRKQEIQEEELKMQRKEEVEAAARKAVEMVERKAAAKRKAKVEDEGSGKKFKKPKFLE